MPSRWTILKIGLVIGAIYMFVKLRGRDAAEALRDVTD
jgi:hypothetical protein